MKKRKKFINFGVSTLCMSLLVIPVTTIPLVLQNNNKEVNISDELINSYDNIFNDNAEYKINNLFFLNNLKSKINENVTKNDIKEAIEFNKTTFLYSEISKINHDLSKLDDALVDEIYDLYQEEISKRNSRCGWFFTKHFWNAVCMKARALLLNAMSIMCWSAQLVPVIVEFAKTLNGAVLAEAFASFSFKLPNYFKPFLEDTVRAIKKFKKSTNCQWKFYI